MARSSESFNRRERERNKKMKADAKRARRHSRDDGPGEGDGDDDGEVAAAPTMDPAEVFKALEALTATFDAGDMEFEDYEAQRADLLAQLVVE